MRTEVRERPILFSGPMVNSILAGRKTRRKLYVKKGDDRNSPEHLARRLANGLDEAQSGECWIWKLARNNHGYGTLTVNGRRWYAHRLAFELGNGKSIPYGLHICHRCDNPACINPEHLFLGTRSDNMRDCVNKGRNVPARISFKGETNPSSKLSKEDVADIRCLLRDGLTQQVIADRFGVSQSSVSHIKLGRSWL